ncbi:N-acetylmuramoyl-L-alanine amidase [Kocuria marina]|uniref:N-acetylmuramoyl-L-alanine amidase n=1 Tax=Kocuria marina TaxID=223184 RepID=UPI0021B67306|nr:MULTISPECIES: peptidoglycan-binding protein [Kocuria]MCT2020909.1 peptidoglycan-binding protein [Kocuria marina]
MAGDSVPDPTVFDDRVDHAVRVFQQRKGLIVDGVVGPETESALNDAQYKLGDRPLFFDEAAPLHGDDVEELQDNLSMLGFYYGHLDAVFSRQTEYAVKELQQSLGVPTDGTVGLDTLSGLARVRKQITSAKAFSLRDYRRLESLQEALRDRLVLLVPSGAGPQVSPAGAPDSFAADQDAITLDVAQRTRDLLRAVGAKPVIAAARDTGASSSGAGPEDSEGSFPEVPEVLPDDALMLTLQCDWNSSPLAQGVATFFWGAPDTRQAYSPVGQLASDMILRELVARTGALDLGSHARQWSALREVRTAAAWVDLGYLSNEDEASRLRSGEYRARLAEALVCGLQRVLAPTPEPTATGTMSLADIQDYYRRDA